MDDVFDDIDDLEQDVSLKGYKTPQQVMEHKYYVEHNGDWKAYLNSILWDDWCKPNNPIELAKILKEQEIKNHPFNKFI